jgi:signal transduction histidine kinase
MSSKYAIYEKQNMQKANLKALLVSGVINSLLIVAAYSIPASTRFKFFDGAGIIAIILSWSFSFMIYAWFLERKLWPTVKSQAWIRLRYKPNNPNAAAGAIIISLLLTFATISFISVDLTRNRMYTEGIADNAYWLILILWLRRAVCLMFDIPLIIMNINWPMVMAKCSGENNNQFGSSAIDDMRKRSDDYYYYYRSDR